MNIKATIDGEEREFEMRSAGTVPPSTHGIDIDGNITVLDTARPAVMYLRLIRPRHTYAGVVFEEEETRKNVEAGEWYLNTDGGAIHYQTISTKVSHGTSSYIILRPVALE